MPKDDTSSAAWRAKLDQLDESTATAQAALEGAQDKATQTAFEGGDVTAAARQVQQHRDVLAALEGADKEARHQLEQAEGREREAAAQIERQRAQEALQARAVAAEQIDAILAQLGEAHSAFVAAGQLATTHFKAAGDSGPNHMKLSAPGALAGAMQHHAPSVFDVLGVPRAEAARPLAESARSLAGDKGADE